MASKNLHKLTSTESLKLLMEGNQRFVSGLRSIESFLSAMKLRELAEKGQSPFAVVLTCSDSRIPTEILFDRGIGDLFVIRVAGNIVAPSLIASIEFAVQSFGTPLCVVMGHTQCGAIKAAVGQEGASPSSLTPYLEKTVKKIAPAVRSARGALGKKGEVDPEELIHRATIENIRRSATLIPAKSAVIRKSVDQGKLMIVGALYDLHTGGVEFDVEPALVEELDPANRQTVAVPAFMKSKAPGRPAGRKAIIGPIG